MTPSQTQGLGWKQAALVAVGMLISLLFLYLAFKDISWHDLKDGVSQMQPIYLLPCAGIMLLIQFIRALRFGLILSPFCPLPVRDLWDLLNIWAGATMVMPARLGELVRPYLLRRCGASFSSGIGAVMVERFFDLSGLLLLLGVVLWTTPQAPRTFVILGQALLMVLVVGYVIVWLILTRRESFKWTVEKLTFWLPTRAGVFIQGIALRLTDGFGIMVSVKQVLVIGFYSVCIWILFSCLTYLFLLAFSVKAPFLVAVTIHVFICFGVALPSAPGFIGTFHAAGRYALALFGVKALVAISFATVYHLFSLIMCVLLGLISLLTGRFRLRQTVAPTITGELTPEPDTELVPSGEWPPPS
jgi:glycosyltransferase 2 family protein